jgi:hypothetical protein
MVEHGEMMSVHGPTDHVLGFLTERLTVATMTSVYAAKEQQDTQSLDLIS